jgi:hypothetical protein
LKEQSLAHQDQDMATSLDRMVAIIARSALPGCGVRLATEVAYPGAALFREIELS